MLLDEKRLLVLTTHEAIEPIRVAGKLTWRVDARCVEVTERLGILDAPAGRAEVLMSWARHRGRVSSTEAADLTGLSQAHVRTVLDALEDDGLLVPGRANKRGRGFFYAPA